MDAITQWLNNGAVYDAGVSLYETLPSHNKVLLKNFKRKQSLQLHEKLKYELKKFQKTVQTEQNDSFVLKRSKTEQNGTIGQNLSKTSIVQHIAQNTASEEKKHALYFHELPPELRPTLLQANTLFKEMCLLKVELNDLPAEAETQANEIQISISEKQKENKNCWSKIDFWQEHKVAPKEVTSVFEELSPAKLLRKEQYHFAAISKLEKRLNQNKLNLKNTNSIPKQNKLMRAIAKQESNLIVKREELIIIKNLINAKG